MSSFGPNNMNKILPSLSGKDLSFNDLQKILTSSYEDTPEVNSTNSSILLHPHLQSTSMPSFLNDIVYGPDKKIQPIQQPIQQLQNQIDLQSQIQVSKPKKNKNNPTRYKVF